jgi:hypothetical protein
MKKLAFIFLFCLILSMGICAQSTATLYLRGVVSENLDISFNLAETSLINLRSTQSMLLGSVTLGGGLSGGYSITFTSQNGGYMRSVDAGNADRLPYVLSFGGINDINLSTVFQVILASGTGRGIEYPISITFPKVTGQESPLSAGTYEDIVILTVSAA